MAKTKYGKCRSKKAHCVDPQCPERQAFFGGAEMSMIQKLTTPKSEKKARTDSKEFHVKSGQREKKLFERNRQEIIQTANTENVAKEVRDRIEAETTFLYRNEGIDSGSYVPSKVDASRSYWKTYGISKEERAQGKTNTPEEFLAKVKA